MSKEAMQLALEALESDPISHAGLVSRKQAIAALRQALETKREWVGLTDEEIYEYADKYLYQHGSNYGIKAFGKAIEAKLREKNKW